MRPNYRRKKYSLETVNDNEPPKDTEYHANDARVPGVTYHKEKHSTLVCDLVCKMLTLINLRMRLEQLLEESKRFSETNT